MPLYAKVDDFTIPPNKTSGNIVVSGIPFQPKVAFFTGGAFTNENNVTTSGNTHFLFAATVSGAYHSTNTKLVGGQYLRNNYTPVSMGWLYDYESIVFLNAGHLDTWQLYASGIWLLPDSNSWPYPTKITYLTLGGDDIIRSYIGNYAGIAGTGFINVTSPGFQPDVLIDFSMYYVGINVSSSTNNCSAGWATSSGNQGGIAWVEANASTTNNDAVGFNDAIAERITTSKTVSAKIQFVEFTPSGFLLNQTVGGTGTHRYLAIKGGKWTVGNLNTSTIANNVISNTIGFEPQAALFLSALRPYASGITDHNAESYGMATRHKNQSKVWSDWSTDNLNPSRVYYSHSSGIYTNLREGNIMGSMAWYGIIESGFSTIMTLPDMSENFVTFLAVGETNQPVRSKQNAWMYGKTFDEHRAWTYGHDPNGLEIRAFTRGGVKISSNKSAYCNGGIKVSDSTPAWVDSFKLPGLYSQTGLIECTSGYLTDSTLYIPLNFSPKLFLFWWNGGWSWPDVYGGDAHFDRGEHTQWQHSLSQGDNSDLNVGFGAAIDSTHRFCTLAASDTHANVMDTFRYQSATEIVRSYTIASGIATLNGVLDYHQTNPSGFTVIFDTQFIYPLTVAYLAIGGDDLTNVYIGSGIFPTATGIFDVVDAPFKPSAIIFNTQGLTSYPQIADHSLFSMGWSDGTNQWAHSWMDKDAANNSTNNRYTSSEDLYALIDTTSRTLNFKGSFVEFIPSGFRLNHKLGTTPYTFNYIALKGGNYHVNYIYTDEVVDDPNYIFTASGVGFKPTTLITLGAKTYNIPTHLLVEAFHMLGVATIDYGQEVGSNQYDQMSMSSYSQDDWSSAETYWEYTDVAYFNAYTWGLMEVTEFVPDGWKFFYWDTDFGYNFSYLAMGPGGEKDSSKSAYTNGEIVFTSNKYSYTEGTVTPVSKAYLHAYTHGKDYSESSKSCYMMAGYGFTITQVYIDLNIVIPESASKHAYLRGGAGDLNNKHAYTSGGIINYKHAFTEGYLPNQTVRHAYLNGAMGDFGPKAWIS